MLVAHPRDRRLVLLLFFCLLLLLAWGGLFTWLLAPRQSDAWRIGSATLARVQPGMPAAEARRVLAADAVRSTRCTASGATLYETFFYGSRDPEHAAVVLLGTEMTEGQSAVTYVGALDPSLHHVFIAPCPDQDLGPLLH